MVRLTALTDAERARALGRFHFLQPCVEDGVPLARLARQQGVALRTAQRWLQRYRQHGLAGLVRQTRADRGHHRRLTPAETRAADRGAGVTDPAPHRRLRPSPGGRHRHPTRMAHAQLSERV
jgi:putative transposase